MKITASGGTDGANIVLFWPDNMPADADVALKIDPLAFVEKLRNEGKLIWFPCVADGGYTVAIYVRSEVPDDLIVLCMDEEQIPTLEVRGVGYFGGMEYMFKHDSSFLEKYPSMCEQIEIPNGSYSASVYRTEIPETLYDSWITRQAGTGPKRLWDIHGNIAACAVASVFLSLIAISFVTWTVWFYLLAVASTFLFVSMALSQTEWYKAVARANDAFGKAYPSYVVHLK